MNDTTFHGKILSRIESAESEGVFVASDFTDIADINTVWQTLSRMEKAQKIIRIFRGVYYKASYSEILGEHESPSPHHVAMALARKHNWTIAPSGATALNRLGLSTQVSSKWLYVSDGPYKQFSFDAVKLIFRHRSNKELSGMSEMTILVIQALRALGKNSVDNATVQNLRKLLSDEEKKKLLNEAQQTTAWIYSAIKKIYRETQ